MPGEYKGMQVNAGECQGNAEECVWVQSVQVMQGNAEECQVNVNWWVESAKGMEGNPIRVYGSVYIVPGEYKGCLLYTSPSPRD